MQTLIVTIHIISCISLVVLVLLQSGQQGMGVIFGGGGGSLFGSSGAGGILAKLTVGVAAVFFCTSITFTYMSAKKHSTQPSSIILDETRRDDPAAGLPIQGPRQAEDNARDSAE
ncbi:preprotein translocase subunit SecG [Desulfonatronovibrio hydrogenovorans]|uniref:preprotein translocase subunit SecG n=1 Tax=Desulfonatronovibrio hydrogenovorans TaxID=53245 RepID=UPI00048DDD09|nr:preprotein translocase subunit SecG [Desulfonatronovibrio hydrogenovorans]